MNSTWRNIEHSSNINDMALNPAGIVLFANPFIKLLNKLLLLHLFPNKLVWVETHTNMGNSDKYQTVLSLHSQAEERAAVKQGKQPFFMKRSETKRQELIAKYKHLKATGGLEKVVQKRRRKNAMKDHRYVPASRNTKS